MRTYDRRKPRPRHVVNENIRASEVRLIDSDGSNLGVLPIAEAMRKAEEKELDLVLIAEKTSPPVAKIVEYSKFNYKERKKEAERRKGKKAGIKELRFKPNIDDHDLSIRTKRAQEFLKDGDKVKFTIPFYGQTMRRQDLGFDKMKRVLEELSAVGEAEKGPMMEGKLMITIVKPK